MLNLAPALDSRIKSNPELLDRILKVIIATLLTHNELKWIQITYSLKFDAREIENVASDLFLPNLGN